jgi:hypothetical protein
VHVLAFSVDCKVGFNVLWCAAEVLQHFNHSPRALKTNLVVEPSTHNTSRKLNVKNGSILTGNSMMTDMYSKTN